MNYCCEQCGIEIPKDEDSGPCPGCWLSYCYAHHDPENHGPVDRTTYPPRQGCADWDFSIEHYGPKEV